MDWWIQLCQALGLFTGASNETSWMYGFWSGFGSDLGEITLITGAVLFWKQHSCHIDKCWRIARHPHEQDGQMYLLCRKHHPRVDGPLKATEVRPPP